MATLAELRAQAKQAYARGKGNQALKGYSKMPKTKLMSALGMGDAARDEKSASNLGKRVESATKEYLGDDPKKVAAAKKRILSAVKVQVEDARRENPDISQKELRGVAAQALSDELTSIIQGKKEKKYASRNKAPHLVPLDDYDQLNAKNSSASNFKDHRDAVEAAIKAGKKVPAKVLADYPSLAKMQAKMQGKKPAAKKSAAKKTTTKKASSKKAY